VRDSAPKPTGLEVAPHGIVISATGGAGLFYCAVTLWQLMTPDKRPATDSAQGRHDSRASHSRRAGYPWRGLMSRLGAGTINPVAFIRSMIDTMAMHK